MSKIISQLSEKIKKEINIWISKYPNGRKQSAVLQALMIVQENEEYRYLKKESIIAVAKYLNMPEIAVMEIAYFYSMYELFPCGKNKISVCTNVPCQLKNSDFIAKYLKKKLNINFGETTKDNLFSLREVECLGSCIDAPVLLLNKKYYGNLTYKKIDSIIENTKKKFL